MFGYLVANRAILTPEQFERYRQVYCGLCRTIGDRHGQVPRLALTYDMTFLVLLLDSLEEPEQTMGRRPCPAHPFKQNGYRQSKWTDYSADMNVALAYYNCLDDWQDDRNLPRLAFAKALEPAYRRVQRDWPKQCALIESCLRELGELETGKSPDLDAVSSSFGRLMAGLFTPEENSYWRETLARLGDQLGRFIYLMDAVLDESADQKKGRYNPVSAFRAANGSFFPLPTLELLIGEATRAFEVLPLEQDLDLLRNILYSGVWCQWVKSRDGQKKQKTKEKLPPEGDHS